MRVGDVEIGSDVLGGVLFVHILCYDAGIAALHCDVLLEYLYVQCLMGCGEIVGILSCLFGVDGCLQEYMYLVCVRELGKLCQ